MTTKIEQKSKKARTGAYQPGDEILDALLEKHGATREGIFGEEGIVELLTKRLVERALRGELTHHIGYAENFWHNSIFRLLCQNFFSLQSTLKRGANA